MAEDLLSFGRFRLDLGRRELLRDQEPVRLGSRALEILCVIAAARGALVSKDELMDRVWPGLAVEENNLHVHISALRKALDSDAKGRSCIVTDPGRGYRFLAEGEPSSAISDQPASAVAVARPIRAPRLSSVVLPFANLNGDREQQYLADAITDDVTTDLSRLADMLVISRNTAFTYRDKAVNTRQIGTELNVRYVLEGSVRRQGQRVRVNAQLIDAETDVHVWAERFDHSNDDLFALQDEITSHIGIALDLELIGAEAARPTDNPDALDYVLRGRALLNRSQGLTPEEAVEVVSLFEKALALDPRSRDTQAMLALALTARVLDQISGSVPADLDHAERLIRQVLASAPDHALAHVANGHLLRARRNYEGAIPEYERALAANRNWVVAIAALGMCKFLTGAIEEVIPAQERAIRLSPRDPRIGNWYWRIGMVHLLQSRTDDAIIWLERARTTNSVVPGPHAWLASAYALKGDVGLAAAELVEARRLSHDDRYSSIESFERSQPFGARTQALAKDTFFAGLRAAGVSEK